MAKKRTKIRRNAKALAPKKSSSTKRSPRATSTKYLGLGDLSKYSGISKAALRRFAESPSIRGHVIFRGADILFPRRAFQIDRFTSVELPRKPRTSSSVITTSGSSASEIRNSLGVGSSEVEAAIGAILKSSS